MAASPQTGIERFVYLTGEAHSPRAVTHVTHRVSDVVTTVVSAVVVFLYSVDISRLTGPRVFPAEDDGSAAGFRADPLASMRPRVFPAEDIDYLAGGAGGEVLQ